jgi:RNA polymerase-binding transcription factor DksA
VRAARAKMDKPPSNGVCRSCHELIEPERLHANPSAHLCCDCAAEDEEQRRRAQKVGG